jgi:phage FluMu gp28-like protein
MNETITLHLPRLYPKQRAAVFDARRFSIIEASTKAGKTVACLTWIMSKAWQQGKDGRCYWWVAPTFNVAKIAYRRMKRMFKRADPEDATWECNDSECFITLKVNGAAIWFKGADRPDTLYGEDVYGAVVDEASRCKEEAWHAIRSTITATKAELRIIGNVKGRKNWAYQLGQMAKSGDPSMGYHKLTAWDAVEGGVLDRQEIEDAKRHLPEAVFRELYLAEPSDDGGNPFDLSAIRACVTNALSTDPAVAFGADLAKSHDWTWTIGLDAHGCLSVSERWQSDWDQTTNRLVSIIGKTPALIDSTGVGDPIVEQLQRKLIHVEGFKFTSQSKQQLMEGLAAAIQKREIQFSDQRLVSELESFEFEYTRTGVRYSAPEGLHDDGVCALALAVQKWKAPRLSKISDWGQITAAGAIHSGATHG